jgi:hypothetical protein
MTPPVPPRTYCITAVEAPIVAVFRRGRRIGRVSDGGILTASGMNLAHGPRRIFPAVLSQRPEGVPCPLLISGVLESGCKFGLNGFANVHTRCN